jgi:hypothetical protein
VKTPPGVEAPHPPPSRPNTPSWRGAQFKKKHRDRFIFLACLEKLVEAMKYSIRLFGVRAKNLTQNL